MKIEGTTQTTSFLSTQRPTTQTSLIKTANDLPKAALQLIPPVPQTTGNIGNNINISV